jgi:hypothetical protein
MDHLLESQRLTLACPTLACLTVACLTVTWCLDWKTRVNQKNSQNRPMFPESMLYL